MNNLFSRILIFFTILGIGFGIGYRTSLVTPPTEASADVGFARDMSIHHTQAVDMASLLYDRTEDDMLRQLAYDILTTQQGQIGMMQGWLNLWEHSFSSSAPRMAWMGMPTTERMPGMASREQMRELQASTGSTADRLFVELMIPHHQSGVMMAEAAVALSDEKVVQQLALTMVQAQSYEIEIMQSWLVENGYPPIEATDMHH